MGVLTMLSNMKSTNIKAESPAQQRPATPSPAVSSISSYGSGTLLIHGQQPKNWQKKKLVSWAPFGRKKVPARLMNIIWSGLFLMVIIATVVVVAALAENIRRNLWMREEGTMLQPVPNFLEDTFTKVRSDVGESTCIHRRFIWEHASRSSEIIHDMGAKWSAVVDHVEERCLIFDMHNSRPDGCPLVYPWDMDLLVGVPACRGPLAKIAPIRKIMHHICNNPQVNISNTGKIISRMCADYRILQVDKVIIHYFDHHFRRVARRSVDTIMKETMKNSIIFMNGQYFVNGFKPGKAITPHVDDSMVLHEPEQSVKPIATSAKKTRLSITKKVKEQDEVSALKSEIGERDVVKATDGAANLLSSPRHDAPKSHPKPTVVPSGMIKKPESAKDVIPIVIEKIAYPKRVNNINDGVRKEFEADGMSRDDDSEPAQKDYWEVIYNFVDAGDNIFKARTMKELIIGTKPHVKDELNGNIVM